MRKQTGFTLIELVVVIVVLGILAVTAAPRFLNLQSDAREARLGGMKGAIASALGVGYGKMAIAGLEHYPYISNKHTDAGSGKGPENLPFSGCELNGSLSCTFRYGYPDADETSLAILVSELENQYGDSDWKIVQTNNIKVVISARDDKNSSLTQCGILYGPPQVQTKITPWKFFHVHNKIRLPIGSLIFNLIGFVYAKLNTYLSIIFTIRPISGLVIVSFAPRDSALARLSSLINDENIMIGIS